MLAHEPDIGLSPPHVSRPGLDVILSRSFPSNNDWTELKAWIKVYVCVNNQCLNGMVERGFYAFIIIEALTHFTSWFETKAERKMTLKRNTAGLSRWSGHGALKTGLFPLFSCPLSVTLLPIYSCSQQPGCGTCCCRRSVNAFEMLFCSFFCSYFSSVYLSCHLSQQHGISICSLFVYSHYCVKTHAATWLDLCMNEQV